MIKPFAKMSQSYNREWNEYRIIPYIMDENGKWIKKEEGIYYTQDKEDAKETCLEMAKEYKRNGYHVLFPKV